MRHGRTRTDTDGHGPGGIYGPGGILGGGSGCLCGGLATLLLVGCILLLTLAMAPPGSQAKVEREIATVVADATSTESTATVLRNDGTILKALIVVPGRGIMGHILQSGKAELVNEPQAHPSMIHVPGTPEAEP